MKEKDLAMEEAVCAEVEEQFYSLQRQRKSLERTWELNMKFVNGEQYCRIFGGEITESGRQFDWEQRRVFNHIAPVVDTRLSKLSRIRPALAVRAASDDEGDKRASELASAILDSVQEECDLDAVMTSAAMWSEICGTAFYKVVWDSAAGKKVGLTESGGAVAEGGVRVLAVPPFEIYPFSLSAEGVEDQPMIIHARLLPVKDIADFYGVELAGKDFSEFDCAAAGYVNIERKLNTGSNFELVLERYMRPCGEFTNGRLTIVAGGKLLFDGELPYINGEDGVRGYPFIKQVSVQTAGGFFGASVVERLIPVQRAYNAVKNRKHEYLNRISMGCIAVEEGSVDVEELTDEGLAPGKVIIYRQGGTPPDMLTLGGVPEEFWKEEESLLLEFGKISGTGDFSENGDKFAGVTSATGLQLLIEQDDARLNLAYQSVKRAIKGVGRHILRLFKQFASDVRLLKYAGDNGESKVLFFKGSDISGDDVVLEADTDLNLSPAQRRTVICELMDKGLLSDSRGRVAQATKKKILEMMGFAPLADALPDDKLEGEEKID